MTEAEWLTCEDPARMLGHLPNQASGRKLRLFAAACCRRVWHLLPDKACRKAVQIAEDFADGKGGLRQLRKAEDAGYFYSDNSADVPEERLDYYAGGAIFQLGQERLNAGWVADEASNAAACGKPATAGSTDEAKRGESVAQCQVLRDIFGNPFRPVSFPGEWRTEAVVGIARGVYDDRVFDRLPILADALQDAGCADADILAHCRGPGPHVRGCWVVDAVLGKE